MLCLIGQKNGGAMRSIWLRPKRIILKGVVILCNFKNVNMFINSNPFCYNVIDTIFPFFMGFQIDANRAKNNWDYQV